MFKILGISPTAIDTININIPINPEKITVRTKRNIDVNKQSC
jgi:hypothetical protein